MTPRGIRQCNPGNLRPTASAWVGQTRSIDGYCAFDSMRHGIRALALQLLIYQDRHKLHSIREYIFRWAPQSDDNNTEAYVAAVATACGVSPVMPYQLHDPVKLTLLVEAIIEHENGHNPTGAPWCSNDDIDSGIADAIAAQH